MIRINLLPAEIAERRKYERFYPWLAVFGIVTLSVVLLAWAFLAMQVGARNRTLQQEQETAAQLQQQAEAFSVFEEKESELASRQQTVDQALAGRVKWGKLLNELSLVLPSEVWLTALIGQQPSTRGTSRSPRQWFA